MDDRTGGGDHFQVTVASDRFDGLTLLDQHRLVNEALAEPLRDAETEALETELVRDGALPAIGWRWAGVREPESG